MADPFDKAVQGLTKTIAASRFTKTPIQITRKKGDTEGTFDPMQGPLGQIYLNLGDNTNWDDFSNVMHHEDIHAALNHGGQYGPGMSYDPTIADIFSFRETDPIKATLKAFGLGQRVGNPAQELPAYVGAYNPQQMPGLSEAMRQKYIGLLMQNLNSQNQNMYQRIIQNYAASQGGPK